jgi:hypothetical protein
VDGHAASQKRERRSSLLMDPAGTGAGCSAVRSEHTASMTLQNTSQRDFWRRVVKVVAGNGYPISFRRVEVIAFRVHLTTKKM